MHRACDGLVCARLWSDEHVVLNASSLDELAALIGQAEREEAD